MRYIAIYLLMIISAGTEASGCRLNLFDQSQAKEEGIKRLDVAVKNTDLIFTGKVEMIEETVTRFENGDELISDIKAIIEVDAVGAGSFGVMCQREYESGHHR